MRGRRYTPTTPSTGLSERGQLLRASRSTIMRPPSRPYRRLLPYGGHCRSPGASGAWPRFLKLLETTRKQALTARYGQWCVRNGRKKTFAREKSAIGAKGVPTTLFDVFWRLRVRANYRDAESFVMVTGVPDWHREFHDALIALTDLTALLVENLVVQQVGLQIYQRVSEDFQRCHVPGGPTDFVVKRLAALSVRTRVSDALKA